MRRKPIPFGQFGENFIDLILNGEVLERALAAQIPPSLSWKGKLGVTDAEAEVKIVVGDIKHVGGKAGDHKVFECPLELGLTGRGKAWVLPLGGAIGHVSVKLRLTGYCIAPLGVKIDIGKFDKSDISVVLQGEGLLGPIVQAVLGLSVDAFKAQAIDWVNDAFRAAKNRELFFDLEDQVKAAIAAATGGTGGGAGGGAAPPPDAMGGVPMTFGGSEIAATLKPGQSLLGKLPPACEEVFRLIVLTRLDQGVTGEVTLILRVMDEDDVLRGEYEVTCDSAETWARMDQSFYAETASAKQIRFQLLYPPDSTGAGGGMVDTKMKIELV